MLTPRRNTSDREGSCGLVVQHSGLTGADCIPWNHRLTCCPPPAGPTLIREFRESYSYQWAETCLSNQSQATRPSFASLLSNQQLHRDQSGCEIPIRTVYLGHTLQMWIPQICIRMDQSGTRADTLCKGPPLCPPGAVVSRLQTGHLSQVPLRTPPIGGWCSH